MPNKVVWMAVLVVGLVLGGGVVVLALFRLLSRGPEGLGVQDGKLTPCPDSPNCVCSQGADAGHHVEPLPYQGPHEEAWTRLKGVLASRPGTVVVAEEGDYLRAECTSLIFRYVDDLEFLLDREAGVIHVRSASRAGHSDLGVNRKRVEAIRAAFGVPESKSQRVEEPKKE